MRDEAARNGRIDGFRVDAEQIDDRMDGRGTHANHGERLWSRCQAGHEVEANPVL